jgi:hypothetical protein
MIPLAKKSWRSFFNIKKIINFGDIKRFNPLSDDDQFIDLA